MEHASSSKKVNQRRALAIAGSLGLHVLLVLALALSTTSHLSNLNLKGDSASDVEGINVRLVDLHDSAKAGASAAQLPAPQLQRVNDFLKMTAPSMTVANNDAKPNPVKSLTDALGQNPFEQKATSAPAPKSSAETHVKVSDTDNKTNNDLWKAIAPCWNRIADKQTLPVTLEVSFSPLGNLAKPPVIQRNPSAVISNQVLRAESQAIAALSQCGPYLMAFGQEHVQVRFPKG